MANELSQEQFDFVKGELEKRGATPDQVDSLMQQHGYAVKQESLPKQALTYAGRAIDYPSGLVRKGVGEAAQAYSGKNLNLPPLKDVLLGKATVPMTEEMLKSADIGNDYPYTRKAAGFIGDVVMDPATLLTMGGAGAAKAGLGGVARVLGAGAKAAEYANPVGMAMGSVIQKAGKPLYNSAFKNVDSRLAEKGLDPIAPYMYEQGVRGSMADIEKAMQSRMSDLGQKRADIYSQIADKGITIDPTKASQGAREYVSEVAKNPYLAPKAEGMTDYLALAKEPMSVHQASDVKTSLYDALPDSAFSPNGGLTDSGKKLLKNLSTGYKNEIEAAAEFAKPGLGSEVQNVNKEWGSLIGAQKPTRSEIAKAERGNLITQVKSAVAGASPKTAALMYGAQAINSPRFRTNVGLALDKAASTPAADALWKQILLGQANQGEE